jgi:CDP-diacylglycerol--glycerol-3-phosphate 3-phosphatidyltransferase
MNLANKITVSRFLLIPVCLYLLLSKNFGNRNIAAFIFILAALTDMLDGYIARSKKLITNFGKFLDPLVDKLLVISVLVALVELNNIASWIVIIIICREFIVTGFRLIAVKNKIIIPADKLGKIKTVTQMLMTIFLILNYKGIIAVYIKYFFIIITLFFTILSGFMYIYKNKSLLK